MKKMINYKTQFVEFLPQFKLKIQKPIYKCIKIPQCVYIVSENKLGECKLEIGNGDRSM